MRDRKIVERAQELFAGGMKRSEIGRQLGKSSSDISRWCRKPFGITKPTFTSTHQERLRYFWYTSNPLKLEKIDKEMAALLLSTLYWCEGAKYPGTSRIEFVSSDEKMQIVFINLMRLVFSGEIDELKFRVMLQLHTSQDAPKTIDYWSRLLNIPTTQFVKPHITIGKNTRYRHTYNGTCALRYHDYRLLLRIMGNYDQASNQIIDQLV